MDIGDRLRSIRESQRLRAQDVANKLGVSSTTVSNIERNNNTCLEKHFSKLCDIYCVPPADVINEAVPIDALCDSSNNATPLDIKLTPEQLKERERILQETTGAETLAALRALYGIPLSEIGDALGMSIHNVSQMEDGKRVISSYMSKQLNRVFGIENHTFNRITESHSPAMSNLAATLKSTEQSDPPSKDFAVVVQPNPISDATIRAHILRSTLNVLHLAEDLAKNSYVTNRNKQEIIDSVNWIAKQRGL